MQRPPGNSIGPYTAKDRIFTLCSEAASLTGESGFFVG